MKNIKVNESQLMRFEKIKDHLKIESGNAVFASEAFEELLNEWEHNILNVPIPKKAHEMPLDMIERHAKESIEMNEWLKSKT